MKSLGLKFNKIPSESRPVSGVCCHGALKTLIAKAAHEKLSPPHYSVISRVITAAVASLVGTAGRP